MYGLRRLLRKNARMKGELRRTSSTSVWTNRRAIYIPFAQAVSEGCDDGPELLYDA